MSNPTPGPGLRNQSGVRTGARVGSVVLLLLAAFLAWKGVGAVREDFASPDISGAGGFKGVLLLAGAGFSLVFAFALASLGWMGASARYGAGETMPVVKDSATYLSDGEGVLGVGRTKRAAAPASGPFCRQCGVRNDADARFCDGCGATLA